MWIGKAHYTTLNNLIERSQNRATEMLRRETTATQQIIDLKRQVAELTTERTWFMHRLNQVERERGQLIQAAIGTKIAVPEFVPTYEDPGAALNDMPSLNTVGADALDQFTPTQQNGEVDYSNLPGYKRQE